MAAQAPEGLLLHQVLQQLPQGRRCPEAQFALQAVAIDGRARMEERVLRIPPAIQPVPGDGGMPGEQQRR